MTTISVMPNKIRTALRKVIVFLVCLHVGVWIGSVLWIHATVGCTVPQAIDGYARSMLGLDDGYVVAGLTSYERKHE